MGGGVRIKAIVFRYRMSQKDNLTKVREGPQPSICLSQVCCATGKSRWVLVTACALLASVGPTGYAKAPARKPVSPVVSGGTLYSAGGDGQDQYVIAADASSGKELWRVKVFHSHVRFWMETDAQLVFITDLKLVDKSLFVRDERSRCYSIDLTKKRVKKQQCGAIFSQ
jgi:hypothetical protein